jgi:Flp pilus assembly pilin Flp
MLNYLRAQMARLRTDEEGQTLIEYALLAFLVAIISIVLLSAIGLDLAETFDEIENALGLGDPNTVDTTPGTDDQAAPSGVNEGTAAMTGSRRFPARAQRGARPSSDGRALCVPRERTPPPLATRDPSP